MRRATTCVWATWAVAAALASGCAEGLAPPGAPKSEAPARSVADASGAATTPGADAAPAKAAFFRPQAGGEGAVPKGVPRKIVYTAEVGLVVDDFGRAAEAIARLVEQFGGYVAQSDVWGTPGARRQGRWKARVPVESFGNFVDAVVDLGELRRRQTDSQDVTEEFYDLEARIRNKQVEERRLIEHLEDTTGELKDILEVERELSRVREEVERFQGRLRLLADLTSLTTVTIHVEERTGFTPEQAPTFVAQIGHRFRASVDQLVRAGKAVVLALVSVVPWLPVWAALLAVVRLAVRGLRRRLRVQARDGGSGTMG